MAQLHLRPCLQVVVLDSRYQILPASLRSTAVNEDLARCRRHEEHPDPDLDLALADQQRQR